MKSAKLPIIAVVIPCFKVRPHILVVLAGIGPSVARIYAVDDCCPERSGDLIEADCADPRVMVLRHAQNQGVGGAMVTGYRRARADGADIIVKIDGDGQMDPSLLDHFTAPIIAGRADYTKGNRFFDITALKPMPPVRVFGNAGLSFLTKLSSGYWTLFDPTNGYTAIHAKLIDFIPLDALPRRYFFESDMLFRLGTLRACVMDIPMAAVYGDEVSNMNIKKVIPEFLRGHARNFTKRLVYNYFLRDFSLASLEFVAGVLLIGFGTLAGLYFWIHNGLLNVTTSSGTVMLAALPIILGLQLLLSFIGYDIASVPSSAIFPTLPDKMGPDKMGPDKIGPNGMRPDRLGGDRLGGDRLGGDQHG